MTKSKDDNREFKTLVIDEEKYKTILSPKFEKRVAWTIPDESFIKSFIPGTVSKLNVQEGDVVKEGDKLMILDAMKMKNQLYVPFDSRVRKINVVEGQTVPKGYIMVELELLDNL